MDFQALKKHPNISSKVVADIGRLPFSDSQFDLATANMVVEHLECPLVQFAEVNRVLVKGGCFIFHTPNLRGYVTKIARLVPNGFKARLANLIEQRAEADVYRTHYQANTVDTIQSLAKASGFEVAEINLTASTAALAVLPPLFVPELLWIRLLLTKRFRNLRTNIIARLRKP